MIHTHWSSSTYQGFKADRFTNSVAVVSGFGRASISSTVLAIVSARTSERISSHVSCSLYRYSGSGSRAMEVVLARMKARSKRSSLASVRRRDKVPKTGIKKVL
jgi:hypothetical protein